MRQITPRLERPQAPGGTLPMQCPPRSRKKKDVEIVGERIGQYVRVH